VKAEGVSGRSYGLTDPTRLARTAVICLAVVAAGLWVAYAIWSSDGRPMRDTAAYWEAAQRIVRGEPLYGAAEGGAAYRYAPWFAAAWIPGLALPMGVAYVLWGALLLIAWIGCLWPLRSSPAAVLVLGAMTFQGVWYGNVQSVMLAPLVYRIDRRDGPIWIGIAASLKATPILLALIYAGRGEWRRAAVAASLTALLVAPIIFIGGYPLRSDAMFSLFDLAPIAWAGLAAASVIGALLFARTRYAGFVAGLAVIASLPRFLMYDIGMLLAGSGTPSVAVQNAGNSARPEH